jgi:DNA primase
MAFISRNTIDELNNRINAVAIVGEYVRLEQRGGRWWGLCPFHNEKTPSFTVNPELKSYYCFGCSKGGSVLNFVMEMDKLSFPEAVEQLANKLGVEIIYDSSNSGGTQTNANNEEIIQRKEALFELYRRMSGTFHHFLIKNDEGEMLKRYIIGRGLNEQMIDLFQLGYAPANRQWMHKFLLQKGYSQEFLAHSGLFSARHPDMALFSGRLMFPIADRQGRVVAFGGRFLESESEKQQDYKAPKYINSPELEIYKKGETLFAINLALAEIRKTKIVYLAEGYMDVIALHQAGITNAVAPLGTAFTDEQAKLLRRWAEKAILVFDSDEAGQRAAVKGILTCRKNGLSCAIVVPQSPETPNVPINNDMPPTDMADILRINGQETPPPKDPADILKIFGPEALQKNMKCFINDFDYLLNRAKSLYDIRESGGKSLAIASLFPYLQTLESEVSRDACIETAAIAIGTSSTAILNDLRQSGSGTERFKNQKEENLHLSSNTENRPVSMNDELFLLMTVAVNDMSGKSTPFFPGFRNKLNIRNIEDPNAKELYIALEECFVNDEIGLDYFLARISSQALKKFCLEKGVSKEFTLNSQQVLADGIKKAERKKLERQLDEIVINLKTIKANNGNSKEAEALLAEKMHIDKELRMLCGTN